MKHVKRMIALLLICALSLSVTNVFAADMDEEGNLYQRMREACAEGNDMDEWVVEGRRQIAEELGLTEYLDENAYLSLDYRNENQTGKDGVGENEKLDLLLERANEEETQFMLMRHMIQVYSEPITSGSTVTVTQEHSPGNNSMFSAPGAASTGYCAQNSKSYWSYGTSKTGTAQEWDDATVRKILYYAPGGPGYAGPYDLSGKATIGNDADHATFATGYQNGDSHNNTKAKAYISFLEDQADPLSLGYKAYKIDIPDPYQDVAFLVYEPLKGTAQIIKTSSNQEITNGNACYSLAGAEFEVYTSSSLTSSAKVGTLKTDANGKTDTLTLDAGTYYVKETKAPMGYAIDSTTKTITVETGQDATLTVTDHPQVAAVDILLEKVDADTNSNKPQGSGTLAGAEFTVRYYAVDSTTDPALEGTQPVRTWVFRTNEQGVSYFSEDYLVSGDKLYLSSSGVPSIPLGTITITETKAAEGYLINREVFVRQIKAEGTAETVTTYNKPTVKEKIQELTLTKINDKGEVLGGAEFSHTRPDGSVETLKTNDKGSAVIKGLEHGVHRIQEKKAPDGYGEADAVFEFTVNGDCSITNIKITKNNETGTEFFDYEITGEGNLLLTVTNQRGIKLPATGSSMALLMSMVGGASCFIAMKDRSKNHKEEGKNEEE